MIYVYVLRIADDMCSCLPG